MSDSIKYGQGTDTVFIGPAEPISSAANDLDKAGFSTIQIIPFSQLYECKLCTALVRNPKQHRRMCNTWK